MNLVDLILEAASRSELPLKAAQLVKLVKPQAGRAATPKTVAATLDGLVSSGRLNRLMAGKTALFTTQGLASAAEAVLRSLIATAKQPPQAAKLRAKLPLALQPHFEAALAQLVAKGAAFVLPGTKRLVHVKRPKPSELLDAAKRRALQKIFDEINALRVMPVTLADFAAWLDAETFTSAVVPPAPVPEVLEPDETLLQQWYEQDRLRSSTMMIAIPRTFEHYAAWAAERGGKADSQVLRNLMEELYNNGRILLEPCERPQDLPQHERAMLVPMSLGPPGYSWCWIA
jgi:hypothetical protein